MSGTPKKERMKKNTAQNAPAQEGLPVNGGEPERQDTAKESPKASAPAAKSPKKRMKDASGVKAKKGEAASQGDPPLHGAAALGRGVKKVFANEIVHLTLVLLAITTLSAVILGFLYNATSSVTGGYQETVRREAMEQVMKADSYSLSDAPIGNEAVTAIHLARQGGRLVGYAVEAGAPGYGGAVRLMVGVDLQGQVTGVAVIDHSETPGLGSLIKDDPAFAAQFVGQTAGLSLGRDIDAISGATVSSEAVTVGVGAAVGAVLALQAAGG